MTDGNVSWESAEEWLQALEQELREYFLERGWTYEEIERGIAEAGES